MSNSITELWIIPKDSDERCVHQDLWIHVTVPDQCLPALRDFREMNRNRAARIILRYKNGRQQIHSQNSDGTISPVISELCA